MTRHWTKDDIARIIIKVGQDMGISPRGIVIGLAVGLVESNLTVYGNARVPGSLDLPYDAIGSDGLSVGVQQQQVIWGNGWWWGPVEVCQDPTSSTRLFFQRLAQLDYNNPNRTPGSYAQAIQRSAYPDRYDQRISEAQDLYDRLVGGTVSKSENGWAPAHAGPDILEWVTVPGTRVRVQLMKGWPSILLRAWVADWNAYIEPVRDEDSAGFTPTNAVPTSNHLNGTACDVNWNSHPFRRRGTLNAAQMKTLEEMEDFYEGTVFWAGRWDDPIDEMHSQMGYDTWMNPHTQDVINRKIRADGFSTFRRDQGDTELDATQTQMLSDIHTALFEPRPSASKYTDDPTRLWRLVDLLRIDDGRSHEVETERQALLGNPDALALVKREADKGDVAALTVYRQCPGVNT